MAMYEGFAEVYDLFMDNIPYDEWCAYLTGLLGERGIADGLVLELGCGTGQMTERLAAAGYDMIGVDNSPEMLEEALEKRERSGFDILYLLQDMRSFELYGTVRAVVCVCDSLNYILEEDELLQVFSLVNNYLDPGGYFIFDLNTVHKYRDILGDSTIAENRDEGAFIWENYFDEETMVNAYELALFIPAGEDGLMRRCEEEHLQRAYELEDVLALLGEAGLAVEAVYDAFTREAPTKESERVYVVAREREKGVEK